MLLEVIAALVVRLIVAVTAINLVFLCSVVYRRVARGWYSRQKDEAAMFGWDIGEIAASPFGR